MADNTPNIEVLASFATDVAGRFTLLCQRTIREREVMQVALAGGTTPRVVYEALAAPPFRGEIDYSAIEFYQGDERPVAPDHPDSNWGMACASLLDRVGVPESSRFRMMGECPDLGAAAEAYSHILVNRLPLRNGTPVFDLILLGVGTDGHTASLFPGTAALDEVERPVAANRVPQLDTTRLTLTVPVLNAAREVWFLVAGAFKAGIVSRVVVERDPLLPASRVVPQAGSCRWLIDPNAASRLPT